MTSTCMQKNQREMLCILGCVKWQILRSEMVNSTKFKNLPAGQYLLILCRLEYKLFHIDILQYLEYIIFNI
jgi:hypothetical protein